MNMLLARFGFFLILLTAIAGSTLVQGTPAVPRSEATACLTERAAVSVEVAASTGDTSRNRATRPVRWQSLLPGAFR